LEYIWKGGDVLRSADERLLVTLRFDAVHELRVENHLNQAQRDQPQKLNWGFAEVATVSVGAALCPESGGDGVTVIFWKEAGPWITVTANSVTIRETHLPEE